MQQIQLNIIPFTPTVTILKVGLFREKTDGYASLHKGEYPKELWEQYENELKEISHLYCNFSTYENADYTATIDIKKNSNFGLHYFRFLIYNYLQYKVDVLFPNFVNDVEVWQHDKNKSTSKFNQYNKFTLKVQYARVSNTFELVVSYDGTAKLYTKSMQDIGNIDTNKITWVNSNGKLFRWQNMPPEEKQELDKIFPLLNSTLKKEFEIPFDKPDFSNRYPRYLGFLNGFYNSILNTEGFKGVIPLSDEGFWKVNEDQIFRTKNNSNELLFGNNTLSINPLIGMKNGPYKKSPHNNVKFFFIYHPEDKATAVKNIYNYFNNGFYKKNEKGQEYKAFPDIFTYIKQPLLLDIASNIEIQDKTNIVAEVDAAIKNTVRTPNTQYVAIYISPIAKTEENTELLNVYYKVKEILIKHEISSQVIFNQNLSKKDFNYYLPNIEVALLAKLGGVPWRLNCSTVDELIVGVGAFYSYSNKTKYVGSAFCFNNEGIFEGFDCFSANETIMLAGSIRNAVTTYVEEKKNAKRLIIHFYKKMSEQELEPILDVLHHLELDIPVIIVSINKTESKELLAFDINDPQNLMPLSGTILQIGKRDYLLCNNTRYNESSTVKNKEYHFPIKLHLTSTHPEIFDDIAVVKDLMDQVYQFSRMYWKSISQQSLPVTTLYPEMVAEIYPHFENEHLSDFGKNNLWFL
jgi:hypothetical protein